MKWISFLLAVLIFFSVLLSREVSEVTANANTGSSLSYLQINFGSPSAVVPLDGKLKHEFTIKNTSDQSHTVTFSIINKDEGGAVLGFPQPQILFFAPLEEKRVITFLEKERIASGPDFYGEHFVNLEWTF
ncbi:MAG: hypothetical protein ACOYWZ_19740 [Bacillota bacterium]